MIIVLTPIINDHSYHLAVTPPRNNASIDIPEPIWYQQRHPFITIFFYGKSERMPENSIPTIDVQEAILFIEKKYCVDFIIYAPKEYLVYFDAVYEYIQQQFSPKKTIRKRKKVDLEKPFIYHQQQFYSSTILSKTRLRRKDKIRNFVKQNFSPYANRPLSIFRQNPTMNLLSLGGWCGPMVALIDMKLRHLSGPLPFDAIHTTMSCLCEMILGDKEAIYQLGKNTLTPHDDILDETGKEIMEEKLVRFYDLLKSSKPNLFIRTIINQDFETEFEHAIRFMKILENKFKRNDKMLLLLHDQKIGTVKIKMLQANIMVWATQGQVGWHVPNRLNIFRNYTKAIEYALEDSNWKIDKKTGQIPYNA